MLFKIDGNIMITDVPKNFDPLEVFKSTESFTTRNQTLHKEDEELSYTVLVDKGSVSPEEVTRLHPSIQAIVQESPDSRQISMPANVRRVQFIPTNKEQHEELKKGNRIVLKSSTDENTCQALVSCKIFNGINSDLLISDLCYLPNGWF